MTTSEMVRKLCKQRHVSLSELARRVGQSPQNFSKKLQRETLTLEELNQISLVLGVSFEQSFVLPGGARITTNYAEDSANVCFEDEFDTLLSAMTEVYPLCIFANLTQNTYHIFEYDKFTTKKASVSGVYDELIRVGGATIPNAAQSAEFMRLFNRRHLLELYNQGKKHVMLRHVQTGDDGIVRWMETNVYFRRAKGSGDVITTTTARCIDEDVQQTWLRRLVSTLAEDFEVIYLIDPENGHYSIERLSDRYASIISRLNRGEDFFESLSESIKTIVHPDDREMMISCLKKENVLGRLAVYPHFYVNFRCLVDSIVTHYEMKVTKADDMEFGNKIVIGIHDRSEAETAKLLEKTNTSVREAMVGDYSSVFYVDGSTNQCTAYMFDDEFQNRFGKILCKNASFTTVLSLFVNNYIHPEDRAEFTAAFNIKNLEKRLSENRSFSFITRKLSNTGFRYNEVKIIRVGEADDIKGFIIGTSDNDEMIRSSLAMAELSERVLAVTNSLAFAYEAVVSVDLLTGDAWVCSLSEKLKNAIGDLTNTVIPITPIVDDVFNRMMPQDCDALRKTLKPDIIRARLSEKAFFNEEFRIASNGRTCFYQLTIGRFGDGSNPDKVIVSCLDHTEELQARAIMSDDNIDGEREAAKRVRAERLLSVSHDLRTPMNAALGYTEMARRHPEDAAMVSQCLEKAHEAENKVFGIILRLLEQAKLQENIVERVPEKGDSIVPVDFDKLNIENLTGKRVLVVDDNQINREIACEILEEYGMRPDEAESGEEAVAKVCGSSEVNYDFVLMDIQMTGIDGYDATRCIRAEEKFGNHLPIIALTANVYQDDVKKAMDAGMDAHLPKPVDVGLLLKTLCDLAPRV